ncbi:hypothetical protein Hamer_G014181 [Homarus americanus]|uniref:Uncharacterized protein n=1 Tax=Homarus americanus TaxID=6706 RepID=A0A8J5MS57_HOMAM|nr:hypothetical protein Hamer_G014181 [Homarus americanus]
MKAEETGECQCMAALKYHSSHPTCTLYEMAPFESADCNDVETCQAECQKEAMGLLGHGTLRPRVFWAMGRLVHRSFWPWDVWATGSLGHGSLGPRVKVFCLPSCPGSSCKGAPEFIIGFIDPLSWTDTMLLLKYYRIDTGALNLKTLNNFPDSGITMTHKTGNLIILPFADVWDAVTNGGDLNYILDDGTVLGQSMCTSLKEEGYHNLQPSTVYLAYNLCSGGWKDVSIASDMLLCCEGGVYPGEC